MKVTVELIAIELPQFGKSKTKDLDLTASASLVEALDALNIERSTTLLTMVNGEAIHRDGWSDFRLKESDTISLFRPFKGG